MENGYIVYMLISPSNKRYIGLTCQEPNKRWQNGKGYKNNIYFDRAINKYGWDNFQHIIIAKGLTEDEAKWLEEELIREWDSTNRDKGYNTLSGGQTNNGENNPFYGKRHTEETKQKISEANKGKKHEFSEEHKQKIGESNKGKTLSEETKQKISESRKGKCCGENHPMFGKQHSEETKQKISEANKGNDYFKGKHHTEETKQKLSEMMSGENNPNYGKKRPEHSEKMSKGNNPSAKKIICLETMEIFDCIKDASEKMNCNYSGLSIAIKNNKKYKGYTFVYYDEYLKE